MSRWIYSDPFGETSLELMNEEHIRITHDDFFVCGRSIPKVFLEDHSEKVYASFREWYDNVSGGGKVELKHKISTTSPKASIDFYIKKRKMISITPNGFRIDDDPIKTNSVVEHDILIYSVFREWIQMSLSNMNNN